MARTQWYCKNLLLFTALFICKHGAPVVADSVNQVQAGLFTQLLQSVRPVLPAIPEALCCYCESQQRKGPDTKFIIVEFPLHM